MNIRLIVGLWLCISIPSLYAQVYTIGPNSLTTEIINRRLILSSNQQLFHPSVKYYDRRHVARLTKILYTNNLSVQAHKELTYLKTDNPEWFKDSTKLPANNMMPSDSIVFSANTPTTQAQQSTHTTKALLGLFYKTPAHLFEYQSEAFHLALDPIINLQVFAASGREILFENQRGVLLRGSIDKKMYYALSILETQGRYARQVQDFEKKYRVIPGAGFYKRYNSKIFNSENAVDYFLAEGFVGFQATKHIGISFGHGRQFIGNGIRSLLLSDFSTNRLFLKFDTRVWKFHYQNIFSQLQIRGSKDDIGDQLIPSKYMAAHYLTLQIRKNINLGVFESVVFARPNQFELQYLNPFIFYRTIESAIGSPDNVVIGLNADWSFLRRFQIYGQLVLDEFKLSELFFNNRGWWANKYGWQIGLKYINALGVNNLDLQFELNTIRPYTYTHIDSTSTYTHYNQALAHPLGANFREWLVSMRYQPIDKLSFQMRMMSALVGDDPEGENFGSNVLLPTTDIPSTRPYGNFIGQGIQGKINIFRLDLSYQLFHNMYLDLQYFLRNKESQSESLSSYQSYIGGGIRINIDRRMELY